VQCLDIDWKTDDATLWHNVWFVGDQHLGATGCVVGQIRETVQEIKGDERAIAFLLGDCGDFINFSDKRFDIQQVAPKYQKHLDDLPRVVADDFCEIYEPIKDKIKLLIPGNHEETVRKRYHSRVARDITEGLSIPLLDTINQVRIRLRSERDGIRRSVIVKGVLSHAHKGAILRGAKISATGRIFDMYGNHDFIAQAHMHEYDVGDGRNLDVVGKWGSPRVKERVRMMFLTGSYLRTYGPGSSYGEVRAYPPTRLGSPHMKMRLRRGTHDEVELRGE